MKTTLKLLIIACSTIATSAYAISMSPSCYVMSSSKINTCDIKTIESTLIAYDVAFIWEFVSNHEVKFTEVNSAQTPDGLATTYKFQDYKKSGHSIIITNVLPSGCISTESFKEKDGLLKGSAPSLSSNCTSIEIKFTNQAVSDLKLIKNN